MGRFTAFKKTVECYCLCRGEYKLKVFPSSRAITLLLYCFEQLMRKSIALCPAPCVLLSAEVFGDCELQILAH